MVQESYTVVRGRINGPLQQEKSMTTQTELLTKKAELDTRSGCKCQNCTCKNCSC